MLFLRLRTYKSFFCYSYVLSPRLMTFLVRLVCKGVLLICSSESVCDRKPGAPDGGKSGHVEHRPSKSISHSSMRDDRIYEGTDKLGPE